MDDQTPQSGGPERSPELTTEQVLDALPAFVLGALDPDEMLAIDAYLQAHPELAPRLRAVEETAALMAHAAPGSPLPAELKQRVLAQVRSQTDPARPVAAGATPFAPTGSTTALQRAAAQRHRQRSRKLADSRRRQQRRSSSGWGFLQGRMPGFSPLQAAGGLVALALVVLIGVGGWQLAGAAAAMRIQLADTQSRVVQLEQENQTLDAQIAALQSERVALQTDMAQLETANTRLVQDNQTLLSRNQALRSQTENTQARLPMLLGAQRVVELGGTALAPEAGGAIYLHDDQALLVFHGLQELPADQAYQLWLVLDDGGFISLGLLSPHDPAPDTLTFTVPAYQGTVTTAGISLEPAGGSQTMDGPAVLLGEEL